MNHTLNISYLERIKSDSGLTHQQIAESSGVPIGTVKRIFSGSTESPGIDALADIVSCMGGSLDDLMGIPRPAQEIVQLQTGPESDTVRSAYELSLINSRASFENAYTKLIENTTSIIRSKDIWLRRLFWYAVSLTAAFIIMAAVAQFR